MAQPPIEYPEVFGVAERASGEAQTRFVRSTRGQLILLVLASAVGAFSWSAGPFEVTSLLACAAFLGAAALRLTVLRRRLHRRWFEGRAIAESVKTMAWRYAVGGHPFPVQKSAADEFTRHVADLLDEVTSVEGIDGATRSPSSSMDQLRNAPLPTRRAAYLEGRILDQLRWYSGKARWNRGRAEAWGRLVLALQLLAAAGAFLRGVGLLPIDLFGVAGALVASAAAWLETKQHASLASSYAVAAEELERIRGILGRVGGEADWARFVAESEEAISREHTLWKVTSSERGPVGLA